MNSRFLPLCYSGRRPIASTRRFQAFVSYFSGLCPLQAWFPLTLPLYPSPHLSAATNSLCFLWNCCQYSEYISIHFNRDFSKSSRGSMLSTSCIVVLLTRSNIFNFLLENLKRQMSQNEALIADLMMTVSKKMKGFQKRGLRNDLLITHYVHNKFITPKHNFSAPHCWIM